MLIKNHILFAQLSFEKKLTKHIDWGWKKLLPKLPKIIKKVNKKMLDAQGASGMKVEERINPQKIKNLLSILSAKKPKIGWNKLEQIWVIATNSVAIAIEKPSFDAIKGISGFKNPVYTSLKKWARLNQIIALLLDLTKVFMYPPIRLYTNSYKKTIDFLKNEL